MTLHSSLIQMENKAQVPRFTKKIKIKREKKRRRRRGRGGEQKLGNTSAGEEDEEAGGSSHKTEMVSDCFIPQAEKSPEESHPSGKSLSFPRN